MNDIILV